MAKNEQGTINVQTENIFPIIKKFLYSDHEIFVRELVSNAVDATQKLNTLSSKGEVSGELGDTYIDVILDKEAKTLTIRDRGIGMTKDEIKKYINQIAFSGAEEFLEKYKDEASIIGHFGLGFYSGFMVADTVEIKTKSFRPKTKSAHWACDGSPNYELQDGDKKERGTDIILHINEESKEFLEDARIETILKKFCKFLPVEIRYKDEAINNTEPAWTKTPSDLSDEDYTSFYKELYPYAPDPMFHIHLNVDYPFNLTGVLYFPKLTSSYEVQKNKIQLYCNQVFVTDSVEEIVPEYLMLLHGVIDSPDIPLNVSRSYLQGDPNVKKINSHISKKVADKLADMFKENREDFESKWNDLSVFVKYGMLSDDKFYERASKFCLVENTNGEFATLEEYQEKIKANQTDKDEKLVMIYTSDPEGQHSFIAGATEAGYDVLKFAHPMIDTHFVNFLEQKLENVQLKRVDADIASNLIDKDEKPESVLNEDQENSLKELFQEATEGSQAMIELKAMSPTDLPVTIVKPEFMRRMKEMQAMQGMDMAMMGGDTYSLVVNTNHPLSTQIIENADPEVQKNLITQLHDLALLSQGMLKGEGLTEFIKRSVDLVGKEEA